MRLFLAVLLVALASPGFAALSGALRGADAGGILAWCSQHLPLIWAGAAGAVSVALFFVERPRGCSVRAYVAQLRSRFRSVQGEFERAVESALPDRKRREPHDSVLDVPGAGPERLDGREAVDNTRR